MCLASNANYKLQAPIGASAIGIRSSDVVGSLSSSLSAALENAKSSAAHERSRNSCKHSSLHPHIITTHSYHDHANDEVAIADRPARGGVTQPFPIRLHKMLDTMEADGHADVMSWQPHGRCFVIHKPKDFKELLPVYFKVSKLSSFQRQLNLYGFLRLTRGRDKNGYYNEFFLRNKLTLGHKIQRTKVKGTGVRARSNPAQEPRLWEMEWVGAEAGGSHHGSSHHGGSDGGSVSSHQEEQYSHDQYSPDTSPTIAKTETKKFSLPVHSTSAFMPPLTSLSRATAVVPSSTASSTWPQQQLLQQGVYAWQPQQQTTSSTEPLDTVMSFGGKSFHYLDTSVMVHEAQLRQKQADACRRDDMQAFMSSLELDNLYVQLDDKTVDNDDAFMDMLERVIE